MPHPRAIPLTLFDHAQRFVGVEEFAGDKDHPLIQWWLSLCAFDPASVHDEVAWCSAFMNGMAWDLGLPRSRSAMARSWLRIGEPVESPEVGFDVAVFSRPPNPGSGHVGVFAGWEATANGKQVLVLGGNQGNQVSVAPYPAARLLGFRRLR